MLTLNHVSFSYRKSKTQNNVLSNITLSFDVGKIYAIYGPSGSGKTTCLSLLGGLDTPTEGTVEIDGTDIKTIGYSELRKHYVAYIFQDYHLFPYMTPMENVMLAASISKTMPKKEQKEKAAEHLLSIGIDEATMNRPVNKISGGQQQRTAIARALIKSPTYILADEPTGNLDKENAGIVLEILRNLAKQEKKCVIIATHSEIVRDYADVTMTIRDGKLLQEDEE